MKRALLLFILITLSFFCFADNPDIIKLSDVKPGMTGEGRTIFKGTEIETFKFKVLGVVEQFAPLKNLIIVELEGPVLEEAGIIAGMSGSPVYIDGKLMGAVSYGFSFSKRPIGGVTPIEDILDTDYYDNPTVSIDVSDIKVEIDAKNMGVIADKIRKRFLQHVTSTPHKTITPIKLIGTCRGFDPSVLSLLNPVFSMGGSLKAAPQTNPPDIKAGRLLNVKKERYQLRPADAVSIPLIRGDFEFASSGTVTHVDGKKVYLFGHPYFNLGHVEFPLHKADVISVVPSYRESFKMAATRHMVGTVTQDRFSSVQGELGRDPYMIPMNVFLKNRNRSFKLEMIVHPLLTPILSAMAMQNICSAQYKDFGFQSLKAKGTIFIENEKNVEIDDLYTGANAAQGLTEVLLVANYFLMNNPDKPIRIQKIDFEISASERTLQTHIDNVILDKQAYLPGELINVAICLKNERGALYTETLQIKAPKLKVGSTFYILVGDRNEIIRFETRNMKGQFFPQKLNTLIRSLNNLRKNNRIYIKLMTPSNGIFVNGHEYSDLPEGMQNVFVYNTKQEGQAQIKISTITEYQFPLSSVAVGGKLFKLKIKERSDAH